MVLLKIFNLYVFKREIKELSEVLKILTCQTKRCSKHQLRPALFAEINTVFCMGQKKHHRFETKPIKLSKWSFQSLFFKPPRKKLKMAINIAINKK